jgi:hypothetical protein
MNIIDVSRSLSILPISYETCRPHHVVLGLAVLKVITASSIYNKMSEKVLSVLSEFSEKCIPLIYHGLVPDALIRFGIRVQL